MCPTVPIHWTIDQNEFSTLVSGSWRFGAAFSQTGVLLRVAE